MDEKKKLLTVANLEVRFNSRKVLDKISFEVEFGDTLAIIGPNGAGKTVLFRAILGLVPYTGEIKWDNETKIGYVPQRFSVAKDIPLTVFEFMQFKEKSKSKVLKILGEVGFSGRLISSRMGVLSGGEFQRVLIAYALLGNPNVLLFDEPTSGVDMSGEETIYSFINKIQKERGLSVIFISHELGVVYKYASNVLCLNKEKVCYGPPLTAIDKESLAELYGEEVNVYRHRQHEKNGY